ncbi:mitochondrial fission ELM1 family protein [Marinivivus vitaminiproducens]|uniref:mitochondrial fission ELM1 family protein n=1 Tax=Marinivivus vitaminiproducens TaxID=3035935 RepID=UPI0027A81173|nr:ELM1/GtrOC1 family putative glycosyltransferase [Geminicoccaceae bacterium SCSIO 64248]
MSVAETQAAPAPQRTGADVAPLPRVWLMMGVKDGDNAQIQGLAEGLGWPFEVKRMIWRRTELFTNLLLGPNLLGIDQAASSPLDPPWPDLIISAGRRNEPVCRWVQRQAHRQGHRVRLVHVGRPWAYHECFDLIVTTPQYRLPDKPMILQNEAPLHRVTEERLAHEGALWAPRFAHLPRPYIAVMIGGNAGPYVFDDEAADLLGRFASDMAKETGGSVLVTTSRRTPKAPVATLRAALDVPHLLFEWTKAGAENPFYGFIALADRFIVTSDSMSMLTETASTLRPVHIFDLDDTTRSSRPLPGGRSDRPAVRTPWWLKRLRRFGFKPLVYRLAMAAGPIRVTRDVSLIHERLTAEGRAAWMGEPFPQRTPQPFRDMERAVARTRELFPSDGSSRPLPARAPTLERRHSP